MEQVLAFLKELSGNNNREWFQDNKKWYEESREKVLFLTDVFINEISRFDPKVSGLTPKDCMFRIFRDVRFSKDKSPYKTNFGSFICPGGRKSMNPGYYFHIEPGSSFIAAGIYMPPSDVLKAIRSYLAENADEFIEIMETPDFKNDFPELYDHKLKTAPKGFPKDHEFIELLRYKSYVFSKLLSDNDVAAGSYVEQTVNSFRKGFPVNAFLYKVLGQ